MFASNSCAIAVFETHYDKSRQQEYEALLFEPIEFDDQDLDPAPYKGRDEFGEGEEQGLIMSKQKFKDLKDSLPDVTRSVQLEMLHQVSPHSTL